MKKIDLYQCEFCGTQYKNRQDAVLCEKNHRQVKDVISANYVSCNNDRTGMPIRIQVVFSDGSKASYRRE